MQSGSKRTITDVDRERFKDLYNLYADEKCTKTQKGSLSKDCLDKIFEFVAFQVVSTKQQMAIDDLFKKGGGRLTFEEFLMIFNLKASACFDKGDLMRMFRLFSKEYEKDNVIAVERVVEVLAGLDLDYIELEEIMMLL